MTSPEKPTDFTCVSHYADVLGSKMHPADIYAMQMAYMDWRQQTDLPKLIVHADPGLMISPDVAAWYRDQLPNTETVNVGPGFHYIQEDHPRGIGAAIADWMQRQGL